MASSPIFRRYPGYLYVRIPRQIASIEEAFTIQRLVRSACQERNDRRVMFDNRYTVSPTESVRETMFSWACFAFERAALVLQSQEVAVRANVEAMSRRAPLRAFHSETEAAHWLSGSRD